MKGKMKKIIAGIATLAMAAQFAFVLPASAAATEYFSQDFEDDTKYTLDYDITGANKFGSAADTWYAGFDNGKMAIATESEISSINKYFSWSSGGSGPRGAYYNLPETARPSGVNQQVLEFDFKMNGGNGYGSSQLVMSGVNGNITCNADYSSTTDYLLRFDMPYAGQITVNEKKTTAGYGAGWAHAKAIMNFERKAAIVSIASLDGSSTYLAPVEVPMGKNATAFYKIFAKAARAAAAMGIDNVKLSSYDASADGTIYTVTYSGMVETETEAVVSGNKLGNIPENPLKMGGYSFNGKWKDTETETEYTAAELAELAITSNKTFEAQFDMDASAIEKMASMSIKTHPVLQPELPVKSADGSDNSIEYPVELSILGEAGNELTADDYPYAKGELTVTWTIDGFDTLKGVSTGEPDTRDGKLIYCDSYMELTGFTGNATKGKIKLTSGIGNYFGMFKVKVKYGNSAAGYIEKEDSFPLIILADANKPANQIYPLGGYFENLNWYSDSLIGYNATTFSGYNNNPDPFLSGWCTWGGRSIREMSLQKDEATGDKYLFSTSRTATNSSNFAAFNMGSIGEQAYIDTDIQFSDNGELISLRNKGERNSDDTDSSRRNDAYRAIHTAPYSHNISFNGSALTYGESSVAGMEAGKWYRLRLSFDDTAQEFWYQVWEIDDTKRAGEEGRIGTSLGKTAAIPYSTSLTKLPYVMNYFVLGPTTGADKGIKLKNMTIYKPEMTTFSATTDAETLTIPEGVTVATTNLDATKNTVKVTAEKAAVTAEVTNKTDASEKVNAFVVCYTEGSAVPAKVTMGSATVAGGATKLISVNVPTDAEYKTRKLFVWTDKNEPLIEAKEFQLDTSDKPEPVAKLSTIKKDADGNDLSGNVTWSLAEDYDGVTLSSDPENANNAILTVAGSASPGEVYAIAANRGQTSRVKITLTGSADNVAFLNPTTSVTIPFDDTPSTATYTAEVRNGDGDKIDGKTVTYALYDANNAQPLANTAAISFDPATATLTVTKDAKGQIVYIRGTSTNTDDEPISKSVKVTIHGLSFDFGASDEEGVHEGYTAVTPSTAYNDDRGYGISGNATAGGSAASDDLDGDYIEATGDMTFRVKVPEGKNYKLNVTYKGALSTEAIDSDCSGVTRTTNSALTRSSYNVAVIGDSLDFKVTDGQIASVEIEMLAAKEPAAKPTWFTYGDSTTNSSSGGKISWANRVQNYTTKFNVSNTAKSGSNPSTFYNGGYMDNILLNIAEGDLVTFNGMGTNSYTGNFKSEILTLIKACEDRGAIVIMTTYTPHGATGNWADRYHSADQTFHGARDTDGYTIIYREVAEELGKTIIDFGAIGDKVMNDLVDAASTTDATVRDTKAQELIGHFLDHNHYDETMANIFAEVFAPPVEAMYDELIAD